MKNIFAILFSICSQAFFAQHEVSPPPPPNVATKDDMLPASITKVYDSPHEVAQYPFGLNTFRKKFANAIVVDSFKKERENTLKTIVSFIVERDGTVTDVQAKGTNANFDAEVKRAVRSVKDKWKPAKYKGETVRSRYRIPLTMNLE